MRLSRARIQNYRSIIDTGEFEVEQLKTILVGPNEAGKTAILQALQQINPPPNVKKLNPLRDYPRSQYTKISRGDIEPKDINVVSVIFKLDDEDREKAPKRLTEKEILYKFERRLDNSACHQLIGVDRPVFSDVKIDLLKLVYHLDRNIPQEGVKEHEKSLEKLINDWADNKIITNDASTLKTWLDSKLVHVDEENEKESERWRKLSDEINYIIEYGDFLKYLDNNKPIFVLYSNYFRVKPIIHLGNLAKRIASNTLDDDSYDYGNICLLNLLGFSAEELSDLGKVADPSHTTNNLDTYREKLDKRSYELNAASVELTTHIVKVWNPNESKSEASKLKLVADGQYLKVVVEDDIGIEVELDQRSEGFQWLVSFFIVFFAEAKGKHKNTILLLDEPGVSLHALKQREFRKTISLLANENQTIYSTHSPFMVGPDELDLVRVVELTDRRVGTKVHTTVSSSDPAALLPLQEALGYDLAQSLFSNQRNLILEGLTDYWYIEAISNLFKESNKTYLNDKISLIPANTASKVVYFATILVSHNLKVAALLDSDNAGDQAAKQEAGSVSAPFRVLKELYEHLTIQSQKLKKAEIEDLLRNTLINVAKDYLNWDISEAASDASEQPIVDVFKREIGSDFSKYKLAKSFLRWSRDHSATNLSKDEIENCSALINSINLALK